MGVLLLLVGIVGVATLANNRSEHTYGRQRIVWNVIGCVLVTLWFVLLAGAGGLVDGPWRW